MGLRSQLALSGGLGVVGGAALTGGTLFLLRRMDAVPLVTGLGTWVLLGFLLLFSLAEIPVMIFGMRQMIGGVRGTRLAILINAAFTFFAAVYAAPFLLLTRRVDIGVGLAGLGLLRFAGAWWLVPGARHPASSDSHPALHNEER